MSPRPHRRQQRPSVRPHRPVQRSGESRQPASNVVPLVPRQRSDGDSALPPEFVADDEAALLLHRATEDAEFQLALDELPLVRMVGVYLDWVGEGVSPPDDDADQEALVSDLERRLGVDYLSSTAVRRRRSQVVATACARMRLVTTAGQGLVPGPDRAGWTDEDPVLRTWLRGQVVAAALEYSVRALAGDHVLGAEVRHALATMVVSAGEGQPGVLGLSSATRPDDLLAEHVDRIVIEHAAELQELGLCAPGGFFAASRGVEPVLRSVAAGLRAAPSGSDLLRACGGQPRGCGLLPL